jgi:putative restriction endonuclease
MVNQYERAYRTWPILVQCARNRKGITYGQLAKFLGIHHRPTRYILELIQDYCIKENLPPLTILARNQNTGLPGPGFIAWNIYDLEHGRQEVFDYSWDSLENPFLFAADNTLYKEVIDSLIDDPEHAVDIFIRVKVRGMAQQIFRSTLIRAYSGRCAFTDIKFTPCLDAAHIIPWAESTHQQRMDVRNGILMSSIHHRLFDKKLITIDEEYKIRFYDPLMEDRLPYSEYDRLLTSNLHGQAIHLPNNQNHWPKQEWIRQRNTNIEWLQ